MNNKERSIAETLLNAIETSTLEERSYSINCYQDFLNSVSTRLSLEYQAIENENHKNNTHNES